MVNNLPANAGAIGDASSITGSGRSPGGGNGNPLQYCLENSVDRGAWWAMVPGAAKSRTRPKRLSMHAQAGNTKRCASSALGRVVTEAPLRTQLWKLWEPSDMLNLH